MKTLSSRRSSSSVPAYLAAAFLASLILVDGFASALDIPAGQVAFPAAAGIRPVGRPVGPVQIEPEPNVLSQFARPDDFVVFDNNLQAPANANITVVNGGFSGTFGATTVVASASVGSGVTFHPAAQGCISPSQQLYYWDNTLLAFVAIDLTQSTYPRTLVPVPANTALVPGAASITSHPGLVWDYSTNSILYQDFGSNTAKSTIARGIYRLNPVTGTNTLYAPLANDGKTNAIAIKQDGSAVYVFDQNGNTLGVNASVSLIDPGTGTRTVVDGGSARYGTALSAPRYVEATGISWDIVNQRITVFDVGDDQNSSRIIRLDPATATRTFIANGSAGAGATYGGTLINAPGSGFTNTAGRIIYIEEPADLTSTFPATIPGGSATATRVGSSSFSNSATTASHIPPTLPAITSPTAAAGSNGTTATLGGNVTSPGTAIVAPTVLSRGVVYARTSVNPAPAIGGANVTNSTSSAATGTFTVPASGLLSGTQYSYAAYVSTFYGTVYTPVGTFTTAALPTVTTPTVTAITAVSATLGGNVTADGGSTITARGIVYAKTSINSSPVLGASGVASITDASAATGVFTDGTGNNLTAATAYTYRAYATNPVGTAYTSVATFTTLAPPTADAQSVSGAFNTAKPITLTGSDPNTPAQTLTYAVTTAPAHGTLSGTAPNLTYMPTTGYNGTDSFQFTTSTASGGTSAPATVSITIAAGTPTANNQPVSVPFNTATAITLTASDPDVPAPSLTYTLVASPTHGTLSGTAPNLTYTPTANTQGSDSFTFRVSNGTNTSNTANVSLTVAAGTPTANAQAVNVNFNQSRAITLTGSDPDVPALTLTYTVTTQPANGNLSGTAPNLTYTPTTGYTGSDSFSFTVNNGQKTSVATAVSLTVIGQPTITGFSPASGPAGTLVTITGTNLANATGVNFFRNQAGTTFMLISATQVSIKVPTGAATGTLTLLSGSGSNSSSTKFTVTP